MDVYDLKSVKLPYLAGAGLKLFASLVEGSLKGALTPSLFDSAGVAWLRKQNFEEAPTNHPIHFTGRMQEKATSVSTSELPRKPSATKGFQFTSVFDVAKAYRDGSTSPEEVARKVLESIETSNKHDPSLNAFIAVQRDDVMRQASEATERIKKKKPLSIFDGMPVAIKDEIDVKGYPTTCGTSFLRKVAMEDSTVAARLRGTGALIVGKTNMHEIGINVTGLNPHHGTTRNPYNTDHYTGGSSSGSGTAVSSGLVPVAIGADGGGSIRIPSSFMGLVGLKATFGRVSEHGAFPLDWSVAHIGPLAGSATDAALTYALIAGSDPNDPFSMHQPTPSLKGWDNLKLKGLKLGVYWQWFRHADSEVVAACEAMLKQFEAMGCTIHEITIPNLEANRVAHAITIASEMAQAMDSVYDNVHRFKEHALDVRINLALARQFTSTDYVLAQRVRTRMMRHFHEAFQQVDMVITPSTAITAPPIPKAALPGGESDLTTTMQIMRYATTANMTGHPAISFPVGYTQKGLPIGMQAIGRPWDESTLLRMALAAEQVVERKAPQVYYKLLG
jgi:Asp-tRNA(Asn)/Glu-tRNA(Gln) amidotransferase A subunit family amidase